MTLEVSIKAFVGAMDRAGLRDSSLRKWLDEYDGPGEFNRQRRGEDRFSYQYKHEKELEYLVEICRLCSIDPVQISQAAEDARNARPGSLGTIFNERIPWTKVAPGAQAFVASYPSAEELSRAAEGQFQQEIQNLPDETECRREVKQRIGQRIFRAQLLIHWRGKCPLTGIDAPALLRASHIKSWCACENEARQRLNMFNGLLLSANLDAAFDAGLISFTNRGELLRSPALSDWNYLALGVRAEARIALDPAHAEFLGWHRLHHGF